MAMAKTFDAARAEARIYQTWEDARAFAAGANARPDAETFCIMIPPPNVTGSLHMGHAFNNTLQDILVRWHRMRGDDVLWQPGTDHAGIATQMVVERELAKQGNVSRREMGREKFLEKVWEWKEQSGDTIINQLKRLGASCDWSRNAFTMSGNFPDAVIKVFVDMYQKGLIYRGKRLVNWDPHFETAISDLEVEQVEVDGHMWRLRYPLEGGETYQHPIEWDDDGKVTKTATRDYLVVATTRPETMLGDTGVAVHPDDARYRHLIGKTVRLPLVGRSIPIVTDVYADPEKGTGAVKITPAHDFNDWYVGQRAGLRVVNVMSTTAAMALKDNADFVQGCDADRLARVIEALNGADRYEARDWIVQTARAEDWLDGIDPDRHNVPHGDRSRVAVEPFLTDQWYVNTSKIVQPAIDAVENGDVTILPEQDKKVYFHWLENIEPWCISRQLWWGHQIPVWYGPKKDTALFDGDPEDHRPTGERAKALKLFCAASEDDALAQAREYYGEEIVVDVIEMHGALGAWGKEKVSIGRDPDVLDTWFSSAIWPIGTLGWPEQTPELKKYFPTDVLITGFDIIFFWVARMMMMQYAVVGQKPFSTVYVHALVRDEAGKKMSKSAGNVLDPLELIDEFGADAVRFTVTAMAAMGRDLKLSTSRIAGYRNFGTKLWNAMRFAEMNGVFDFKDFKVGGAETVKDFKERPPNPTATLNRWIIGEVAKTREAVGTALTSFRFNDAASALYGFVWGKVCDWYVEFSKPLLQGDDKAAKAETQATMKWVLEQCLILLHPIMPFITEELWQTSAKRPRMLVHADWPTYQASDLVDENADSEMNWVIQLIDEIRSVRTQMHVPAGLRIPMLQIELDEAGRTAWNHNQALIKRLARIERLTPSAKMPKGAVTIAVAGGVFALPLADIIDITKEKARLEKTLGKLTQDLGALRARLDNPKFVASAPAEVVAETRDLLALKEDETGNLQAAMARLEQLR